MSRRAKILIALIPVVCIVVAVSIPNFVRAPQSIAMNAYTNGVSLIKEWKNKMETRSSTATFRTNGFSYMESYVDLLLHSQSDSASVIVATIDKPHVVALKRRAGRTVLTVWPDRVEKEVEESRMRDFFSKRGMTVSGEVGSGNAPNNNDAARGFEFELRGDSKTIAQLCISVFTDLYGTTDQCGSSFSFFGL